MASFAPDEKRIQRNAQLVNSRQMIADASIGTREELPARQASELLAISSVRGKLRARPDIQKQRWTYEDQEGIAIIGKEQ